MPGAVPGDEPGSHDQAGVVVNSAQENVFASGLREPQMRGGVMLEEHSDPSRLEPDEGFTGGVGLRVKEALADDPAPDGSPVKPLSEALMASLSQKGEVEVSAEEIGLFFQVPAFILQEALDLGRKPGPEALGTPVEPVLRGLLFPEALPPTFKPIEMGPGDTEPLTGHGSGHAVGGELLDDLPDGGLREPLVELVLHGKR